MERCGRSSRHAVVVLPILLLGWSIKAAPVITAYVSHLIQAAPLPGWMNDIMTLTMPFIESVEKGCWPNSCNVNYYEHGGFAVDWHSDNEGLFQSTIQDTMIISLSLGAPRVFELKYRDRRVNHGQVHSIRLEDGDILTMEQLT